MNFGKSFQDFCEINTLTKSEAIRILEKVREGEYGSKRSVHS